MVVTKQENDRVMTEPEEEGDAAPLTGPRTTRKPKRKQYRVKHWITEELPKTRAPRKNAEDVFLISSGDDANRLGKLLKDMITKIASKESFRPALTGLVVSRGTREALRFVGADGVLLMAVEPRIGTNNDTNRVLDTPRILTADTVKIMAEKLRHPNKYEPADITFTLQPNDTVAVTVNGDIVGNSMPGQFPDYRGLLAGPLDDATVEAAAFDADFLKRVATVFNHCSDVMKVTRLAKIGPALIESYGGWPTIAAIMPFTIEWEKDGTP